MKNSILQPASEKKMGTQIQKQDFLFLLRIICRIEVIAVELVVVIAPILLKSRRKQGDQRYQKEIQMDDIAQKALEALRLENPNEARVKIEELIEQAQIDLIFDIL